MGLWTSCGSSTERGPRSVLSSWTLSAEHGAATRPPVQTLTTLTLCCWSRCSAWRWKKILRCCSSITIRRGRVLHQILLSGYLARWAFPEVPTASSTLWRMENGLTARPRWSTHRAMQRAVKCALFLMTALVSGRRSWRPSRTCAATRFARGSLNIHQSASKREKPFRMTPLLRRLMGLS